MNTSSRTEEARYYRRRLRQIRDENKAYNRYRKKCDHLPTGIKKLRKLHFQALYDEYRTTNTERKR